MKVLVGLDGSTSSMEALKVLKRMPFTHPTQVALATVCAVPQASHLERLFGHEAGREKFRILREAMRAAATAVLDRTSEGQRQSGLDVTTRIEEGQPSEVLLRMATEDGYDLIIMGSHGSGRANEFALGSVTKSVLEHSPCTMLVGKRRHEIQMGPPLNGRSPRRPIDLLLAYDGSTTAWEVARRLPELLVGSEMNVDVLRVVPSGGASCAEDSATRILAEVAEREWEAAQVDDAELMAWLKDNVNEVHYVVQDGDPASVIVEASAGMDLVVAGRTGMCDCPTFPLGSVAARVAQHASCSVMIVG